ncbi:hypothetical protein N9Y67_01975 [Pseudomonadota bacterium]|nr:hypothetical protein [Pseudomonadota bacterium]
MTKKINVDGLAELLKKAQNDPAPEPSARQYIVSNYHNIMAAKANGVTFASMAEALGISANSFSIALSKAKAEIVNQNYTSDPSKTGRTAIQKPATQKQPQTLTQEY